VEGSSLPEVINRANICVAIVVGEIKRLGLRVSPLKTGIVAFDAPGTLGAVKVDGVLVGFRWGRPSGIWALTWMPGGRFGAISTVCSLGRT